MGIAVRPGANVSAQEWERIFGKRRKRKPQTSTPKPSAPPAPAFGIVDSKSWGGERGTFSPCVSQHVRSAAHAREIAKVNNLRYAPA